MDRNRYLKLLARFALSLWTGGAALFTFVLTPALFKGYDRDAAGKIVGFLFPGYFSWGLAMGIIALAALAFSKMDKKKLCAGILCLMLTATAVQAFLIEPRAAALKREIPTFAATAPDTPERAEFRKLHGVSSGLNLGVIVGGAALLLIL